MRLVLIQIAYAVTINCVFGHRGAQLVISSWPGVSRKVLLLLGVLRLWQSLSQLG